MFIGYFVLWVMFLDALPAFAPPSKELIFVRVWVVFSVDTDYPPDPERAVICLSWTHCWDLLGTPMELQRNFWVAPSKLRFSSTHFPNVPPSTPPLTRQLGMDTEVGENTVSRMYLPDQDPEVVRRGQRLRLIGKAPAGRRLRPQSEVSLPTPKRWNRLVLPDSVEPMDEVGAPPKRLADPRASDASDMLPQGKAS